MPPAPPRVAGFVRGHLTLFLYQMTEPRAPGRARLFMVLTKRRSQSRDLRLFVLRHKVASRRCLIAAAGRDGGREREESVRPAIGAATSFSRLDGLRPAAVVRCRFPPR